MNAPNQGNPQINMIRLSEDSDIGLIQVGFSGKVNPETKKVEIWATFALGQSNGMGGLNVAEINFRKVGEAEVTELIKAFEIARENARQKSNLIVPV